MSIKNISDFFSEISVENIKDFVEKYLTQIVYGMCFVSVIIFLTIYAMNRKIDKESELITSYYQAVSEAKNDKNEEALKILKDIYNSKYASDNIKTIAGIRMAIILGETDKKNEAVEIYKSIYSLKNSDRFLKNLSGLSALNILINENNPQNYPEIEKLFESLKSIDNPLFLLVREQEGIFEIQKGNVENGIKILSDLLLENGIDDATKSRIELILKLYRDNK